MSAFRMLLNLSDGRVQGLERMVCFRYHIFFLEEFTHVLGANRGALASPILLWPVL